MTGAGRERKVARSRAAGRWGSRISTGGSRLCGQSAVRRPQSKKKVAIGGGSKASQFGTPGQ